MTPPIKFAKKIFFTDIYLKYDFLYRSLFKEQAGRDDGRRVGQCMVCSLEKLKEKIGATKKE